MSNSVMMADEQIIFPSILTALPAASVLPKLLLTSASLPIPKYVLACDIVVSIQIDWIWKRHLAEDRFCNTLFEMVDPSIALLSK